MHSIDHELLFRRFCASGFSYSKLADDANLSRGTIHNVMLGRCQPSHYVASRLAEVLNLTRDDIIAIFFPNITRKKEIAHD